MFLIYFLVFTGVFTLFENIVVAIGALAVLLIVQMIGQWISAKKMVNTKAIGMMLLGFVLAGISFGVKEWRYYERGSQEQESEIGGKTSSYSLFAGEGIIQDIANQGKYILNYKGGEYLLYSSKEYAIGDQLRIVGNLQKNIKSEGCYVRICSGTFDVPLFSGSFDFTTWMKMKGWKGSIYETNAIRSTTQEVLEVGMLQKIKKSLQQQVIKAYGQNRVSGLILGMIIGDKSQIPESEYQYFIDSGLVHLIAVSGGNILMIVVFLQFVL